MDVLAACSLSAAAVAFFGHAAKNSPIDALGTNTGAGRSTRVWGYDSARGEFSTLATACIFAPFLWPLAQLPPAALAAACACLVLLCVWYVRGMHASHPGGPRKHRILREPQWPDKEWHIDQGWHIIILWRVGIDPHFLRLGNQLDDA